MNRDSARFCAGCGIRVVPHCTTCDRELADGARFCDGCGAPVVDTSSASSADSRQARKTVTVIFADLEGSTALQERMDPESVRGLMARYYAVMSEAVEAFDGRVVKFVGDGVMAVFGIPGVAEDDALRSLTAAAAMQEAFSPIADDLGARYGTRLGLRIGVNTGEVVVDSDDADIVGDVVNVAARLQTAAAPGDVVVGNDTWRVTRHAAQFEPLAPLELRGRAELVDAHRLVSIVPAAEHAAAPFVGRGAELATLQCLFDDVVAQHEPALATVIGSPGVGKSRLLEELCVSIGERARVLRGRCDPAVRATFAPVAELLHGLGPLDALVADDPERDRVLAVAAGLVGTAPPGTPEETFWAVRRLVERAAQDRPIIALLDDVHWAEPLLLDLVEHLAEWTSHAPVLFIAAARPELRETRSSLAEPDGRASAVVLVEGLNTTATAQLACELLGSDDVPPELLDRLVTSTEGNPLFVRELTRMLIEDAVLQRAGDGWTLAVSAQRVDVPPTIQSLLAARLDRLQPDERVVLERAAVIGSEVYRGALEALAPSELRGRLDVILESLRRKELLESAGTYWIDEPVLRFHHVLIRDAAYRRLLREARTELHEKTAAWFLAKTGGGADTDEFIGYHLEQALDNRRRLGPLDEHGRQVARDAAARLASVARRALDRDDLLAAANVADRAIECLDADDADRGPILLTRCEALLGEGDVAGGGAAIDELVRVGASDPRLEAWSTCFSVQWTALVAPRDVADVEPALIGAIAHLAAVGDSAGQAKGHRVHASVLARLGRVGDCEAALDRALASARDAQDRRQITGVLTAAPLAALWGPSPVPRAGGRCLDVIRLARITTGALAVEATSVRCQAVLEALRGRVDAARNMIDSARRTVEELGLRHGMLEVDLFAGIVELYGGAPAAADAHLARAYQGFTHLGVTADAAQAAALRGRAALAMGNMTDALAHAAESDRLGGQDLKTAITWRSVRAEVLARQGDLDGAIELAQAAVALAEPTDALIDHADALATLAVVTRLAGDDAGADAARGRALALYERKGAVALAERLRPGVAAPAAAVSAPATGATSSVPAATAVIENQATRVFAHYERVAFQPGGVDTARLLLAEEYVVDDHRAGLASRFLSRDEVFQNYEFGASVNVEVNSTVIAVRGERLGLLDCLYRTEAGDVELLMLVGIDDTDLVNRASAFDRADIGSALELLDELYRDGEGAEPSSGAVLVNAATRHYRRLAHLLATGRAEDIRSVLAPDAFQDDRRAAISSLSTGRDAVVENFVGTARVGVRTIKHDVLAVRGDRFALARALYVGDRYEVETLSIMGVDANGHGQAGFAFDPGATAEALAELDRLYLASGDAPSSVALRTDMALSAAFNQRDWTRMHALYANDIVWVDHRPASYGETQGIDAVFSTGAVMVDATPEFINVTRRYLAVDDTVTIAEGAGRAESAGADGGPYEITRLVLTKVRPETGLVERIEMFAPEQLADALARFDQLADAARGIGNTASRTWMALNDVIVSHDYDAGAELLAESCVLHDLRPGLANRIEGRAGAIDQSKSIGRLGVQRVDNEVLAVRGDRVALLRGLFVGEQFETPALFVAEVDESGRGTLSFCFNPEQLEDALVSLEERFLAGEGATHASWLRRTMPSVLIAHSRRDWAALRAAYADDLTMVDHRPAGMGVIEGADAVVDYHRTMADVAPSHRMIVRRQLAIENHVVLFELATGGAGWSEGSGPYEIESLMVTTHTPDGRTAHIERFALDDLDHARTRFHELAGGSSTH